MAGMLFVLTRQQTPITKLIHSLLCQPRLISYGLATCKQSLRKDVVFNSASESVTQNNVTNIKTQVGKRDSSATERAFVDEISRYIKNSATYVRAIHYGRIPHVTTTNSFNTNKLDRHTKVKDHNFFFSKSTTLGRLNSPNEQFLKLLKVSVKNKLFLKQANTSMVQLRLASVYTKAGVPVSSSEKNNNLNDAADSVTLDIENNDEQDATFMTDSNSHNTFKSDIEDRTNISNSHSDKNKVKEKPLHVPVLVEKVVEMLDPKPGQVFVDMTFGAGGHTKAMLQKESDIRILALDRDPDAYDLAVALSKSHPNVTPMLGKFSDLNQLLLSNNFEPGSVDGFFMDAGASTIQYDNANRGFAIMKDGPLDMRMDKNRIPTQPTAADVVNFSDFECLYKIFKIYGEDKMARHIARAIEEHRMSCGRIYGTQELADVVSRAFGKGAYKLDALGRQSHIATKAFMALRIFVNNELNEVHNGIELARHFLSRGGACAAITFHSLEDRIVKRHFHGINMDEKFNMSVVQKGRASRGLTQAKLDELMHKKWIPKSKRPVVAETSELKRNPKSRSAKLRVAVKA